MSETLQVAEVHDVTRKYTAADGVFFFTGIQALVRVPLDQMRADRAQGLSTASFISGYQGSPLGGYDRELASIAAVLEQWDVVHRFGVNEELAATSVMGSQLASIYPDPRYDGVVGIWYGKAPGLDRAGDAIRHANYAGTSRHGGVLALTGDDPSNKSSTIPSASEATLADLHLPTLHPGNVQEVLDLGLHGIALSRAAGLWTGVKIVTAVADGSGSAEVATGRIRPVLPEVEWRGSIYRPAVTGWLAGETANATEEEIHEVRLEVARRYAIENRLNRVTVDPADAWLGIVASGHMYHLVIEALKLLGLEEQDLAGLGIRLLQLHMLHPFEREIARYLARGLETVVVAEEKRGFVETHLRDALYGMADGPQVLGKRDEQDRPLVPVAGGLDAGKLVEPLRRVLERRIDPGRLTPPTRAPRARIPVTGSLARTPYLCSGCPHSTSLKVPEGTHVGAGIGCGGMVTLLDPDRVGRVTGLTQMGGEGVHWIGIQPFVGLDHFTQNMGDGTFAHSGSLAIRAAVAAGVDVTYKILYNSAVAMTGGQDAAGAMSVPDLVEWLHSEGVRRVIVTSDDPGRYRGVRLRHGEVWDRSRIVEAQERLAEVRGVTALVHDQQCAAEKRRDRKRGLVPDPPRRVVINERVCEGCGDCGAKSNCLSVQPVDTPYGRKTRIHQSSCNKDYTCLDGDCPSFVTVTPRRRRLLRRRSASPRTNRAGGGARRIPRFDVAELADPVPAVPFGDMTVRMPGIGGTGVVTVSQVLGTAATLDGKHVTGLDQTGLSQKAGPVVSDLRITDEPVETSTKVAAGMADLLLAFDLLVAVAPDNLEAASPERTVAVVSTTTTPTGQMVRDVDAAAPDRAALLDEIAREVRPAGLHHLDVVATTEGLFGDATTANLLQVGIAFQLGALPLSAPAIEQAIEMNGAAVEANTWAFRWGRMWAIDPDRVEQASARPADLLAPAPPWMERELRVAGLTDGELGEVVRARVRDLVDYQDDDYARQYLRTVAVAAASDDAPFATIVARQLHKLMAYKDEYEVARLHLDAAADAQIEAAVGTDVVVAWNLHPPVLRALGMDRKLRLGPWFRPVLRGLRAGKALRGTRFDPFGMTEVRRVERSLIEEYRVVIERLAPDVRADNAEQARRLAELPDLVRGYEDIKLSNVRRYRAELDRMRRALGV